MSGGSLTEETLRGCTCAKRLVQLTIDARIGAYFGRNVVDSQTAPQPPGWNWSESDHVVNLPSD